MSLRVAFIGCVASSAAALETLLNMGPAKVNVVGLVTRRASTFNADFHDLLPLAQRFSLPVLFADEAPDDRAQAAWLRALQPDLVFCVGWSRLLGPDVLSVARHGLIGYHPAALPANRGRHPLIWALALGLHETASSFFFLEPAADSGALVDQRRIEISSDDDASTLYEKILMAIRVQVVSIVNQLDSGRIQALTQDHTLSNHWRKRTAADGRIDWRMPAHGIRDLVRALARPYPGADFVFNGKPVKLWKCSVISVDSPNLEPGKVLAVQERRITVKCGTDAVCLVEHELDILPRVGDYL